MEILIDYAGQFTKILSYADMDGTFQDGALQMVGRQGEEAEQDAAMALLEIPDDLLETQNAVQNDIVYDADPKFADQISMDAADGRAKILMRREERSARCVDDLA